MTAFNEIDRLSFGQGRLFGVDSGGNPLSFGQCNDFEVDFKIDLKEAFGEESFPFAVADGHRTIDLSAKHYLMDQDSLAESLGGAEPDASNTTNFAVDETGVIDESAHTYALANTTPITPLLQVVVGVLVNGVTVPVRYVVTGGSPVAGVSYSISGHTLTFASGDDGLSLKVTYFYTASDPNGDSISLDGGFQNSQPFIALTFLRRDASRVDGSTGYQAWKFARVRDGGFKAPNKEGEYTIYERTFKAFADPWGHVLDYYAFNA